MTKQSYFDLQVNGYAGIDFNSDSRSPEQFAKACRQLKTDCDGEILATIITDDLDSMCKRIQNICAARDTDSLVAKTIAGIHIEGPFISGEPGYVGAHPAKHVLPADLDSTKRLLDAAQGLTKIVTLAPEHDAKFEVTRMLVRQGVTVSAGHCDPSLDCLKGSIDAGLSMVTHLGNGCPLALHRHDNIVTRVFELADQLAIGFIADGIHVPYWVLKQYLSLAGFDRAFVVTDAIAAAGCGAGEFQLGSRNVIVDEELATWTEDRRHLVGSAAPMPLVVERLKKELNLNQNEIDLLTKINPRKAIKG